MHHPLRNDKSLNEVTQLRGSIVVQAKRFESARFSAEPSVDTPGMWITDNETGNTTCVPLYASGPTLKALAELFKAAD